MTERRSGFGRFDRFGIRTVRSEFLAALMPLVERVPARAPGRAWRAPQDGKFLEVALHGRADALISGDDVAFLARRHGLLPVKTP